MERITKALLIITTLVMAVSMEVEGGRMLKSNGDGQVDQPQNFFGGAAGGVFPGPGFATGIGFGPNGFYTVPGSGSGSAPGLPTGNLPGLPNLPGSPPQHSGSTP